MKFIVIWAFIVLSCNSEANISNNEKFCDDLIKVSENKTPKLSTLSIVKAMFFPSKLVFIEQDRADKKVFVKALGNNHIILNLLKMGDEEKIDTIKNELKIYKEIKKEIKHNTFAKKIVLIKNKNKCLALLENEHRQYEDFLSLSERLREYKKYQSIFERIETQKYAIKSIKKLRKKNWKVHPVLTSKSLYKVFSLKPQQLVLITHATNKGVIIDANNRVIPASSFKNTPTSLRKLSVSSCYSKEFKKTYHIEQMIKKKRFDFIYPILQSKYRKTFKNTTPILGIKALANFHKNLIYMPKRNIQKKCFIKFSHVVTNYNLAVSINNNIVGLVNDNEVQFYCDLLNTKNTITLIKTDKTKISKTDIEKKLPRTFLLESENEIYKQEFKHFYSNGYYSSSKSKL
jgi:hypothetical protein